MDWFLIFSIDFRLIFNWFYRFKPFSPSYWFYDHLFCIFGIDLHIFLSIVVALLMDDGPNWSAVSFLSVFEIGLFNFAVFVSLFRWNFDQIWWIFFIFPFNLIFIGLLNSVLQFLNLLRVGKKWTDIQICWDYQLPRESTTNLNNHCIANYPNLHNQSNN